MAKAALVLFLALLSGCAMTNENVSKSLASGAIGCPMKEITISDETAMIGGLHNFTATCSGVEYFCSYMYPNPINCKERKKSD